MAKVDYLFDAAGNWIAFRRGQFVYSPTGAWLGWVPKGGRQVFDVDGLYLGTLFESDRLFKEMFPQETLNTSHPGYPGREEPADHPGYPGRVELPIGMEDVSLLQHA